MLTISWENRRNYLVSRTYQQISLEIACVWRFGHPLARSARLHPIPYNPGQSYILYQMPSSEVEYHPIHQGLLIFKAECRHIHRNGTRRATRHICADARCATGTIRWPLKPARVARSLANPSLFLSNCGFPPELRSRGGGVPDRVPCGARRGRRRARARTARARAGRPRTWRGSWPARAPRAPRPRRRAEYNGNDIHSSYVRSNAVIW